MTEMINEEILSIQRVALEAGVINNSCHIYIYTYFTQFVFERS